MKNAEKSPKTGTFFVGQRMEGQAVILHDSPGLPVVRENVPLRLPGLPGTSGFRQENAVSDCKKGRNMLYYKLKYYFSIGRKKRHFGLHCCHQK